MIAYHTAYDQLTESSTQEIIEWGKTQGVDYLSFSDILDFCSTQQTTTYEDVAQYIIDSVNEDAPIGHWYYLTADANIELETDDQ